MARRPTHKREPESGLVPRAIRLRPGEAIRIPGPSVVANPLGELRTAELSLWADSGLRVEYVRLPKRDG
jgi:hypothetical protein